jgi:hypothetical protein
MYADDLLLLSISISHLQKMIDICLEVLGSCFLDINPSKSVGLRIGPRHKFKCTLFVNGQPLAWKSELKYLGIFIVSSKKFKCNFQLSRQKFFQAANGIFGKIGLRASHNLILSLIDTFCIPVLLYGLEAMPLSKSERNSIDFTYSTAFFKIFNVKEKPVLKLCQFYSRCLPPSYRLDIRQLNFLNTVQSLKDSLPLYLLRLVAVEELTDLQLKYSVTAYDSRAVIYSKVWSGFESELI